MHSLWLAALAGFALIIFYSRRLQRTGFDSLEPAQRKLLLEASDPARSALPLFLVVAALLVYLLATTRVPDSPLPALALVAALALVYITETVRQIRTIRRLELPSAYLRTVTIARGLQALALATVVIAFIVRLAS